MGRTHPLWCALLLAAGCTPAAGPCDVASAGQIVFQRGNGPYDPGYGIPMYQGQALVTASCGSGGAACHGTDARNYDRHGVPFGFDFDLPVGCSFGPCRGDETVLQRQLANASRVHGHEDGIRKRLQDHHMPPGTIGSQVDAKSPTFVTANASTGFDLTSGSVVALPSVTADRGGSYDIIRNWIACGMPLIEATRDPAPGTLPGDSCDSTSSTSTSSFPSCVQRVAVSHAPPAPTFTELYAEVLFPNCGTTCHAQSTPNDLGRNHLDLSSEVGAYSALVNVPAAGSSCATTGLVRVVPGNPDASLLVQKVEGSASCGELMPARQPYGRLPDEVLASIRAWIAAGAAP